MLAELGEGVLEGGVVGRALGVLHVRHLNRGLVDHARGRVERRRALGSETELVDDREVAVGAGGLARADGGKAGRLAGGVFPLEDGEASLAGKGGSRCRALGEHLQRLFGLGGVEEHLALGIDGWSGRACRARILALDAVDAPRGIRHRVADGARGDRGGGEGLDLSAVLRDGDIRGGLALEARDEGGRGEVRAETGRFAGGEHLVGDDGAVGVEADHQADVPAVALGREAGHRVAGDLRLGVVRIADERGERGVGGVFARDDGLDVRG